MRHTYPTSTETIKVFNNHAIPIAEEAEVEDKYIYSILAGTTTDPFAKFLHYYSAAVRAGRDVSPYDNRMAAIRTKYAVLSGLCVDKETAMFAKESTDVSVAKITSAPLEKQLEEVCQSIRQGERLKKAILEQMVEPEVRKQIRVLMVNGKK